MRKYQRRLGGWMLAAALLCALGGGAVAAEGDSAELPTAPPMPGVLTLVKFDKPPVLDGKLEEGEWDRAAMVTGFLGAGGSPWSKWSGRGWLEPRSGSTYVGYTADRLYIAVVSELPPDNALVTRQDQHEVMQTVGDDGIEIWVTDPNNPETQYQTIVNSVGATFDIKHAPAGSDQGWDAELEIANTIDPEQGVWIAEMSAPLSAFGLTSDPTGGELKLLVARNYKRPWEQAVFMPGWISFRSPDTYGTMRLTADEPVVRIESLGQYGGRGEDFGPLFTDANLKLRLRMVNPGPARKARVKIGTQSTDMPERGDDKTIDLPAGGEAEYAFDLPVGVYHGTAAHMVHLHVSDAQSGDVLAHTGFMWTQVDPNVKKLRKNAWGVRTGPEPDKSLDIAWYPSFERLLVTVDPSMLGEEFASVTQAQLKITNEQGKAVHDQTLVWEKAPATLSVELPDLGTGKFAVAVQFPDYPEPVTHNFTREKFAWEGNTLGITDEVLAPFTPITVEGQDVGVVLRKYRLTGLGLWESVQARGQDEDEDFEELLAAPVQLIANGNQPLEGKGKFVSKAAKKVVYEGQAQHPGVRVSLRNIIEEDGCMKIELTLAPGQEGQELKSLVLDIPMRDAMMPLYHAVSTTLRTNPAGATPAGQGKVWSSYDYPNGSWNKSFLPYIWLGAEARGLAWFADNDKGWVLDINRKDPESTVPPQELIRKGDTLTLRLNLVQKPVTLAAGDEPRTIVFGLMASPAKPMAKDWRAYGRSDHQGLTFSMGLYGLPTTFSSKYPVNADFSAMDYMLRARRGEDRDWEAALNQWAEKNLPPEMDERTRHHLKSVMTNGLKRGTVVGKNAFTVYYDEFHSTSQYSAEAPTYYSEWSGRPSPRTYLDVVRDGPNVGYSMYTAGIVDSYIDFAVWYAAEWLRRGFGIYYDNAFPQMHHDPLTGSAYELPGGRIQPSAGIWARREYLRRIWTLHQQLRLEEAPQIMMIHITNTHVLPYMVWNESNLDLEWKVSKLPIQSKFSPELIRAETLGLQSGNLPISFDTVRGGRKEAVAASRLALLVHEVKTGISIVKYPKPVQEFGYGLPDCKVVNYWDANPPLSVSDDQVKWLLLERNGQRMIILATWNAQPSEVTLTLDGTVTSASDAETDEALATHGSAITVPLNGYGARILLVK